MEPPKIFSRRLSPGASAIQALIVAGLTLWALAIHFAFMKAVSDPVLSPDSIGYAGPPLHLLMGHPFDLPPTRAPLYSIFLYAALKLFHSFFTVLVIQHLVALLTAVGAAFCYYRWIKPSWMGAGVVFFAAGALPIPAIYAHAILTETLYTGFLVAALLFLFFSLEKRRSLYAVGVGVFVCLAMLTRPVGYSLLAALVIAAAGALGKSWDRKSWLASGAGAACVLALLYGSGFSRQSLLGTDRMSGLVLFGTTARYVDPVIIKDPKAQDILHPFYQAPESHWADFNWVCCASQGPVNALARVYPPKELSSLLKTLAFQAVIHHPFRFLFGQLRMLIDFFGHYSEIPAIYLNREYTFFVYRGLLLSAELGPTAETSRFLRHGPQEAHAYFDRMRPLTTHSVQDPETYLAQIDKQDVYHYEDVLHWWTPLKLVISGMRWLPCFAALASLWLWRRKDLRYLVGTLWLVIVFHAALSTLAGVEPRYAVPITPLYWILLVGGIETAVTSYL